MWAADSYVPLFILNINKWNSASFDKGIKYTHRQAIHAEDIYVCSTVWK